MLFRRKKKTILDSEFITAAGRGEFLFSVRLKVKAYQEKGYQVDVQYQLGNSYTALILAYEVK